MPTHPEVVTLDPNDAGLMGELWHAAKGTPREFTEHVRALVNPLPEEPPAWTLVTTTRGIGSRVFYRVDNIAMDRPWRAIDGGWHTWPEVCEAAQEDSGGTPEVLEPDSVKALREQVGRYDAWLARVGDALAEARGVRVHWSDLDTSVKALAYRAEKAEAAIARVEALAAEMDDQQGQCWNAVAAQRLRAALAEPTEPQ